MLLVRTYYQVKPFLPFAIRLAFRRWRAERRKRAFAHVWPINLAAARTPKRWAGWPDGKNFAFVLTHDVEGTRGLEQCRALAELELSLNVRSSFNFVPEGDYELPVSLREYLVGNGFEIGVHDLRHDGKLYWSRSTFRRNARRINDHLKNWSAVGFRSGFMHHNLEWIHDLEVLYDASTFDTDPFEPQPDGVDTIFPFWVDAGAGGGSSLMHETLDSKPGARRNPHSAFRSPRSGYVELPYTLPQDFTLFLLLQEQNIEIWKRKLDWVAAHGGMAMVDVHPDYIDFQGQGSPGSSYPAAFYRELIQYVQEKYDGQYWHALPKQVAEYFLATPSLVDNAEAHALIDPPADCKAS